MTSSTDTSFGQQVQLLRSAQQRALVLAHAAGIRNGNLRFSALEIDALVRQLRLPRISNTNAVLARLRDGHLAVANTRALQLADITIASHDPECRINALLDYLKKEKRSFCYEDWGRLKLTRQQIADMTGLRVETVIRSMRHMHEKGELLIEKGKVFY